MTRTRNVGLVALATAVLVAGPALGALAKPAKTHKAPGQRQVHCTGDPSEARRLDMLVEGTPTYGLYALPAERPTAMVVFFHGYGHTVESWRHHLTRVATEDGVIAFAMNYRGTQDIPSPIPGERPSSRGWQVAEGAVDSIAVANLFLKRCAYVDTVVAYGISMGANAAGLAVAAQATRPDGTPLFDHWFDIEGATNVTETYNEARLLAPANAFARNAVEDIEREMGGPFEKVPDVYLDRTVVARADDIAASGVRDVVIVHGFEDGLVPYNQSREMHAALRALGVPTDIYSVATRGPSSEPGTTLSGYAQSVTGQESPLAGHASEASNTHIINRTSFALLSAVLDGATIGCGEYVVDGTLATTTQVVPDSC